MYLHTIYDVSMFVTRTLLLLYVRIIDHLLFAHRWPEGVGQDDLERRMEM